MKTKTKFEDLDLPALGAYERWLVEYRRSTLYGDGFMVALQVVPESRRGASWREWSTVWKQRTDDSSDPDWVRIERAAKRAVQGWSDELEKTDLCGVSKP